MATVSINAPGATGLLYNDSSRRKRLCVTAETSDFDDEILCNWRDEGFDVMYLAYNGGGNEYQKKLRSAKENLGVGENFAIVAFGEAASYCLDYFLKPTNGSRLCALIAYYPTNIPDTRSRYPPSIHFLTHLAGDNIDVTTVPRLLGLEGKKKITTRQLNPGIGTGERLYIGHRAYTYQDAEPGFAEHDLDEYNHLACDLAWGRSLQVLKKGFGKDTEDAEDTWEKHLDAKFFDMNLPDTIEPYVSHLTPSVTYTPTMSGGIGKHALRRFYEKHFLRTLPPSMRLRLISRTVGADRVVDELHVSLQHTQEIPWMLPGVPPTNKHVEIILVSIVSMRAGQLYSEHVYWDQASVLVQVGLLDPKLLPQGVQDVHRLPVIGRDAARGILKEDPEMEGKEYHNRLIRMARAKEKAKVKGKGVATPGQEESGTELYKSDAERSLENGKGKGKAVQRGPRGAGQENGNGESNTNGEASRAPTETKRSDSVEDGARDE